MPSPSAARVLVVANQTADSAQLIAAIERRASHGPCLFTLLVPTRPRGLQRVTDAHDDGFAQAEARLAVALPLLSEAAGRQVVGVVGSHDPLATVRDALKLLGFDEVIISMLPEPISRWLRLDLPSKVRALGVPVTEVISTERELTGAPAA